MQLTNMMFYTYMSPIIYSSAAFIQTAFVCWKCTLKKMQLTRMLAQLNLTYVTYLFCLIVFILRMPTLHKLVFVQSSFFIQIKSHVNSCSFVINQSICLVIYIFSTCSSLRLITLNTWLILLSLETNTSKAGVNN